MGATPRRFTRATGAMLCAMALSARGSGSDSDPAPVANAPAPAPAATITSPDPAAIDWGTALSSACRR